MAMVSAMAKEKLYTHVSALSAGAVNGIIARMNPGYSLLTTSLTAAIGLLGSLMLSGRSADIMEGVGAGSLGSLGYSMPFWFQKDAEASTAVERSMVRAINGPKMLNRGNGLGAVPTTEFDKIHMYGH